jgi:gliding motility-associated-like protein
VAFGSVINGKNYDPPPLTQPTYYKRFVQSGRCIDYSPTVTITVLNSITGNSITRSDSVICEGFIFTPLGATVPGQGDGTNYAFQWQDSTNSTSWNPASGSYTGPTYTPDTSKFSALVQKRFYRRIVLSGPHNVCKSTSLPIDMTRYPKIKNNLITANPADLTICSSSTPVALPGSNPTDGAGAGSYSFIWQQSTNGTSFNAAAGVNNSATGNYQPPSLTDTTWYRRIVNSGVYKTAIVCTNNSPAVRINVHPPIVNNIIAVSGGGSAETICNNQEPGTYHGSISPTLSGGIGSYTYLWQSSLDNSVFTPIPAASINPDYSPLQLTATTYYRRQVTSGACVTKSDTITETVLPLITNNVISGNPRVCYTMVPDPITGAALAGGSGTYKYFWWQSIDGGTNWAAASGTNTSSTYQPPALLAPIKYERTITSGPNDCCSNTSNVFDIGIDPLPSSTIYAGPDALSLKSILNNYQMQAAKPLTGETGLWKVLNGAGILYDSTSYNTTVGNLSVGGNSFLWTVSNGLCKLSDTVNIELLKIKEPQGFSPNGDTHNDTFIIEGLNLVDNDADLIIVNGAGTEVFKTSSRNNQIWTDWNGKNSAGFDLPEGTYYYMLNITAKNPKGPHSKLSGFIVLKRYK